MSAPCSALPATYRSLSQDLRSPGRSQVFTTASGNTSFDSLYPLACGRFPTTKNAIAGWSNGSRTVGELAAAPSSRWSGSLRMRADWWEPDSLLVPFGFRRLSVS